jgi:hypothetical protein
MLNNEEVFRMIRSLILSILYTLFSTSVLTAQPPAIENSEAGEGASNNFGFVSASASDSGLVDLPDYSVEHGFYTTPFDLTISWPDAGSIIRYTLDGSDPRTSPAAVEGPSPRTIRIDPASTVGRAPTPGVVVRAYARVGGVQVTSAGSQTYIFVERVKTQTYPGGEWPQGIVNTKILDYDMDPNVVNDVLYKDLIDDALLEIPSVCINTDVKNLFDSTSGIYVNPIERGLEWERPVSIELIDPKKREEGFQINGGIRLRGGYSRIPQFYSGQLKHAFRFFFREEYGKGKLKYPLFGDEGVSEFECVDLRTAQNYSWSYQFSSSHICIFNRDVFSRDSQRDMGDPYTRSRNYHLYINGMYWGLYQTQERPEASYAESYFGGDKEDYDVVKVNPLNGLIEATDGTMTAFSQLCSYSVGGFETNDKYFRVQGKYSDGSINLNQPVLANIDNLIDYELVIFYTGNFDAPVTAFSNNGSPNNFYGIYNRVGRNGFLFFAHDAEHTLMDPNYTEGFRGEYGYDRTGPFNCGSIKELFNPQYLHEKLTANIEYKVRFSDHVYKHFFNHGALTPLASQNRLMSRAAEIDTAVIAESARWGDTKVEPPRTKDDDWLPSVVWIRDQFFPKRINIVLGQLKADGLYPSINPPAFMYHSGEIQFPTAAIDPGENIRLVNHNTSQAGSVFYTLDGSDPRLIGGAASSSATDAGDSVELTINSNTIVKARVKDGTTWSALHELVLNAGQDASGLRITELHYNPLPDGATPGTEYEFLELKNVGQSPLPLAGMHFVQGIDYAFPNDLILPPGGFGTLASNAGKFQQRYGFPPTGEYNQQLDNGGERITLLGMTGDTLITFRYNDKAPWPDSTDGQGYSLVAKDLNGYGNADSSGYWRRSLEINGSPGRDDYPSGIGNAPKLLPEQFQLDQNYPNPFNPETTISYHLPVRVRVELKVYDIIGREIATLVNQEQNAGTYTVQFPASIGENNSRGIGLSSGIYLFRIKAGSFIKTQKMVLVR